MPELSNKVIANDIGSAAVALYASAESVIANQLDSLKEQLMETREVSIGTLLGMADTLHSLSWGDLGKILSSNLKQVVSNILQVTIGSNSSFIEVHSFLLFSFYLSSLSVDSCSCASLLCFTSSTLSFPFSVLWTL